MNREYGLAYATLRAARSGGDVPFDAADPAAWIDVDYGVREHLLWENPSVDWLRTGETAPGGAAVAVALCHPDGRVREAALRRPEAAGFPALVVLRCADWARPVREEARRALAGLLPGVSPGTVALVAVVALRAAVRQRGDFARDLVMSFVRSPDRIDALLACADRGARRLGYRVAVEEGHLSAAELARAAATDPDVVVQDLCADAALAHTRDGDHGNVLRPLLASRQPRVRAAGVTALGRTGETEEAAGFLADRSGLVRACARWVLRRHGVDPLPLHRAACAGPDVLPGAPAGLGETGTRADAALLWPLVGHPRPAVRAKAVAALRVLDADAPARLEPLLDDPSVSVVREATTALLPVADRLSEDWLYDRLADDRPRHVRVSAFRLLSAHGPTAQLRCFLRLSDDEDPVLRERALTALDGWGPAGAAAAYRALPGPRRAELDALLERAAAGPGEGQVARVRWFLTAFR
ncbi:HEAT repeat domain-containing protein [Streptomyces mobaraensis]|uniref:HEAT repeat domain-containing protein n=1 Tax=Streptomyces mobaraensis TaxID=35621 RepID=A0A5N5VY59_STRMB|nr:hypothetical protein [Streptomyces mobaraensis]KAB7833603.1 hypothetical protein FRZ00_32965 [Streptomyces mobaraensis]